MTVLTLRNTDARYPAQLRERLGDDAPPKLAALGKVDLLDLPKIALFCSARCPGNVILSTHGQTARWRDEGRCVIGGFHSPIEKDCFRILLRGRQPVILCLARGLEGMRLPADWKKPLTDGRFLALSPFPASERRVTKDLAVERNRLVAALADEVVFAHVTPGGQLDGLRQLVAGWNIRHRTLSAEAAAYAR